MPPSSSTNTATPPLPSPRPRPASSAAANATAAVAMVSFFVVGGERNPVHPLPSECGRSVASRNRRTSPHIRREGGGGFRGRRSSLSNRRLPPPLSSPPGRRRRRARPHRPPPAAAYDVGFQTVSPKKVPFEDTTEAVVALAVRGDGRRGGEVGWRCGGWRGGVGGVVGGFWSICSRPYLYNLLSQFFVTSYFFLQPKSGNRRTSIRDRAEGDGLGKPKAWEAALRLTRRPALLSVFWCVGTGRGHGLEYDGGS